MNLERRKQIEDAILVTLIHWGDFWYRYDALRDEVEEHVGFLVEMQDLKACMHRLRDLYMVRQTPCFNDEGTPFGSGYVLTDKGFDAYDLLAKSEDKP